MASYDPVTKTAHCAGTQTDCVGAMEHIRDTYAEDGWVLTVDDYTLLFTSAVAISMPYVFTLQGKNSSDRTVLQSTWTGNGIGFFIVCGTDKVFTLKDFRLPNSWQCAGRFIQIEGTGFCFHITNLYVQAPFSQNTPWLWIDDANSTGAGAGPFGLIDNSNLNGYCGVQMRQNSTSPDHNWANNHWDAGQTNSGGFGSGNAIFLEDITYNGATADSPSFLTDGDKAAKFVVRYCTINNASIGTHGRDSGGNAFTDWLIGPLCVEAYRNVFNVSISMGRMLLQLRGGTALFWENAVNILPGGIQAHGLQIEFFAEDPVFYTNVLRCSDGAPLTAPLTYPADYPDCQQPGFPSPICVWGNTGFLSGGWCSTATDFAQQNREWFLSDDDSAKPAGYVPYNSGSRHPLNPGPTPSLPHNEGAPALKSTNVYSQSQTLACSNGIWSGYPDPTFTYQWSRANPDASGETNIGGATSASYVATSADVGLIVRLKVTGTNASGNASAYSNWSDIVAAPGTSNLLVNPSFDIASAINFDDNYTANTATYPGWIQNSGNGFNGTGFVSCSTDVVGSGYAWRVLKNGTDDCSIRQNFAVNPGDTLAVSFWYKTQGVYSGGLLWAMSDVTGGGLNVLYGVETLLNEAPYAQRSISLTVPLGCTLMQIAFSAADIPAATYCWVDKVVVQPPAVLPLFAPARILLRR